MAENLLAEGHPERRLFGSMLRRIAALPMPAQHVEAQTGADWMTKEAEGTERCVKNWLESGQFRALGFPEGAGLAPSWAAEPLGMETPKEGLQRRRLGVYWLVAGKAKWKSRLNRLGFTQRGKEAITRWLAGY